MFRMKNHYDDKWLSWAKDMNVYHGFCESLYKCAYTASKPSTLPVYIFVSHNLLYWYTNL